MIIGIMGAMPDEVDQLCAKLEQVTKETYAGVEYHQGMLNGRQVVVCCAGMGKANAASTVQVLITKYGAEKIIFSGIAGNMTSKIGIGDVCVGETVVYHDAQNDMIAQSAPFTAEYHAIRPWSKLHWMPATPVVLRPLPARLPPVTFLLAMPPPKRLSRTNASPTAWRWKALL